MKLSTFLSITAFIYIPFGLAMLLFPAFLYGLYGFELGPAGLVLGQVVGSAIIGMGLINFMARNEQAGNLAMRGILMGNLAYHALDLFVVTPPTIQGLVNAFTWSFVALHLILSIGFAYFLFIRKT